MGIFERLSIPAVHLLQLTPGLLYFILLKVAPTGNFDHVGCGE
jgi:hypothetical protein